MGDGCEITERMFPIYAKVVDVMRAGFCRMLNVSLNGKLWHITEKWKERLFVLLYLALLHLLGEHSHDKATDHLQHYIICGLSLLSGDDANRNFRITNRDGKDYLHIHKKAWGSSDNSVTAMLFKGTSVCIQIDHGQELLIDI